MTVFVSYSSRDRDAVKNLVQDLGDADEQVWMDQRLAGGEAWWRAILEQIRGCDVLIFALSQHSIESKPCQAELQYAKALRLPILPVQVGPVDSMSLNPLATVQAVDYRHQTPNTGMRLIAALNRERARRQPLPEPLPDEPPVPFEYLIRLFTTVSNPEYLTPRDQAALVAQLQVGLGEDGQHEEARNDIVMLLTKLHDREDATHRTRTDVEAILASLSAESPPQSPSATDIATPVESPIIDDAAVRPSSVTAVPIGHVTPASGPPMVDGGAEATQAPGSAVSTGASEPTVGAQLRRSDQSSLDIEGPDVPQKPIPEPNTTSRRTVTTLPPASPGRRVGAALIDASPILFTYGLAAARAVTAPKASSCHYTNGEIAPFDQSRYSDITGCNYFYSATAAWTALIVASVVVLAYSIWNWGYRQGKTGSSIGKSVLGYKVVSEETGQPTGPDAKRISKVAGFTVAALLLGLGIYAFAVMPNLNFGPK